MNPRKQWLVAALAIVNACGESSSGAGTTDTSAAIVSGTVTGFGSVIVDGVEYDDSGATVSNEVDPAHPVLATRAALALGQQVELTLSGGKVAQTVVEATVRGPIDLGSINPNDAGTTNPVANSFTVLGQTVTFTTTGATATMFDGVSDATKLQDGQFVVVFGTVDDKGDVAATRIAVAPVTSAAPVRVVGVVANTNATAHTFTLGKLTIDGSAATIVPSGATIKDGGKVFVFSDQLPTGTAPTQTLKAKTIRVLSAALEGKPVIVGGPVTAVTPVATQAVPNFVVQGIPVDASKATLDGGTAADVKVGAFVRVEGTVSSGTLAATRVVVVPAAAARPVVLIGEVTSYVSPSSFVVRGVPVDGSHATFTNGSADQLADGALVLVVGHLASGGAVADRIALRNPPPQLEMHLKGRVTGYDATAGTFMLLGIGMKLAPTATFTDGTSANFTNGARVEVTGSFDGNIFTVSAVRFLPTAPQPTVTLFGTVSNLTPATGAPTGFDLNNAKIGVSSATTITNGPLANGQVVIVEGQLDSATGTVAASRVDVLPADEIHFLGAITKLSSASNFTVRDQTVDASNATFVPSSDTAADLAVGKLVLVTGSLSNGVVVATTVRFL